MSSAVEGPISGPGTRPAPAGGRTPDRRGRFGLRSVVASEWLKLRTLRMTMVLGFLCLLCFWLFAVLAARETAHNVETGMPRQYAEPSFAGLPGGGLNLAGLLFGLLGMLSVTNEYGSGTITASLQAVPRRGVLFASKALVLIVLTALITVLGAGLGTLAGGLILASADFAPPWGDAALWRNAGCTLLGSVGLALLGFGLGFLLRSSVAAILGLILIFVVLPVAVPLLTHSTQGVTSILPVYLLVTALNTGGDSSAGVPSAADVWTAGLGLLLWGVIPSALAFARFRRGTAIR